MKDDAEAPVGLKKWIIPGFGYLKVEVTSSDTFRETISMMEREGIVLVGAVQDHTDPKSGKNYMLFPIRRIG